MSCRERGLAYITDIPAKAKEFQLQITCLHIASHMGSFLRQWEIRTHSCRYKGGSKCANHFTMFCLSERSSDSCQLTTFQKQPLLDCTLTVSPFPFIIRYRIQLTGDSEDAPAIIPFFSFFCTFSLHSLSDGVATIPCELEDVPRYSCCWWIKRSSMRKSSQVCAKRRRQLGTPTHCHDSKVCACYSFQNYFSPHERIHRPEKICLCLPLLRSEMSTDVVRQRLSLSITDAGRLNDSQECSATGMVTYNWHDCSLTNETMFTFSKYQLSASSWLSWGGKYQWRAIIAHNSSNRLPDISNTSVCVY